MPVSGWWLVRAGVVTRGRVWADCEVGDEDARPGGVRWAADTELGRGGVITRTGTRPRVNLNNDTGEIINYCTINRVEIIYFKCKMHLYFQHKLTCNNYPAVCMFHVLL